MTEQRGKPPQRFLVSVIIASSNGANSVLKAIANVRTQTWLNTQIIVVDDGSTDGTFEKLSEIDNIIVLQQEGQSPVAARHLGLRHATGTFIAILDSDQFWDSDFLASSIEACEKLRADLVFSNWTVLTEKGAQESVFEKYYNWSIFPETALSGWRMMLPHSARDMFLDSRVCPPSGVLLRRASIACDWQERIRCIDDRAWYLDIVLNRPSRVAFTMRKMWTIGSPGNDICTAAHPATDDTLQLLRRYRNELSREEKSKLYASLAKSKLSEVKRQVQIGRFDLKSCTLCCRCICAALFQSPQFAAKKLLKI